MVEFKVGDAIIVERVIGEHWYNGKELPLKCKVIGTNFNGHWLSVDYCGNNKPGYYGVDPKWCKLVNRVIQIW